MRIYVNNREQTTEFDGEFNIRNQINGSGAELRISGVSMDIQERDNIRLTSGDPPTETDIAGTEGEIMFNGVVTQVENVINSRREEINITAADETYYLQWISVDAVYENQTMYQIIADIIRNNEYGLTVSEEDVPSQNIRRINLSRTNAKDSVWKIAQLGGYFWYVERGAIKFVGIDKGQDTLDFVNQRNSPIPSSAGTKAFARDRDLLLIAKNNGTTLTYRFGIVNVSPLGSTATWASTERTATITQLGTNTIRDITMNALEKTVLILLSSGDILNITISDDAAYTAKTLLSTGVNTFTNTPEKLNTSSIDLDGRNLVVGYKGIDSSPSSGNWTLQSGNNNPTGSCVLGDVMYVSQKNSRTVYAYNKDTGASLSAKNKTLDELNKNPSSMTVDETVYSDNTSLYRVLVADGVKKDVFMYESSTTNESNNFAWRRYYFYPRLTPDFDLQIPQGISYNINQSFSDGTYTYIGGFSIGDGNPSGTRMYAFDKDGERSPSNDISGTTVNSWNIQSRISDIGRIRVSGIAANSDYIWIFTKDEEERYPWVSIINRSTNAVTAQHLTAISHLQYDGDDEDSLGYYEFEYSTFAQYKGGYIFLLLQEKRSYPLIRVSVNSSNGTISTTGNTSFNVPSGDYTRWLDSHRYVGFGFIENYVCMVRQQFVSEQTRYYIDMYDSAPALLTTPAGDDLQRTRPFDDVGYEESRQALGIPTRSSFLDFVFTNGERMFNRSGKSFIPNPEAYNDLASTPESIVASSNAVYVGYKNNNVVDGFSFTAGRYGGLTKDTNRNLTLDTKNKNPTGMTIAEGVLHVVDDVEDKMFGYEIQVSAEGVHSARNFSHFDINLDSGNNDPTTVGYNGSHFIVGEKNRTTAYRYIRPRSSNILFGVLTINENNERSLSFSETSHNLPVASDVNTDIFVCMDNGFVLVARKQTTSTENSIIVGQYTNEGSTRSVVWNFYESRFNPDIATIGLDFYASTVTSISAPSTGNSQIYFLESVKKTYLEGSQPTLFLYGDKNANPLSSQSFGAINSDKHFAASVRNDGAIFVLGNVYVSTLNIISGSITKDANNLDVFTNGVIVSLTNPNSQARRGTGIAVNTSDVYVVVEGYNSLQERYIYEYSSLTAGSSPSKTISIADIIPHKQSDVAVGGMTLIDDKLFVLFDRGSNELVFFTKDDFDARASDSTHSIQTKRLEIPYDYSGIDIVDIGYDDSDGTLVLVDKENKTILTGTLVVTEKGDDFYPNISWFLQPASIREYEYGIRNFAGIGINNGGIVVIESSSSLNSLYSLLVRISTPEPIKAIDIKTSEYIERDSFSVSTTSDVPYNAVDVEGKGGISTEEVSDVIQFSGTDKRDNFQRTVNAKFRYITRAYVKNGNTIVNNINVGLVGLDKNDPSFDLLWSYKGRYVLNGLHLPQNPIASGHHIEIWGRLDEDIRGFDVGGVDPVTTYRFEPRHLLTTAVTKADTGQYTDSQLLMTPIVSTNPAYAWYNFGFDFTTTDPIVVNSFSVPVDDTSSFSFDGTNSSVNIFHANVFASREGDPIFTSQTAVPSSDYVVSDGLPGDTVKDLGSGISWKTITFNTDVNISPGSIYVYFVDRQANDSNKSSYKMPPLIDYGYGFNYSPSSPLYEIGKGLRKLLGLLTSVHFLIGTSEGAPDNELNLTATQLNFDISKIYEQGNLIRRSSLVPGVIAYRVGTTARNIIYYTSASALNSEAEADLYAEVLRKELEKRDYANTRFTINNRLSTDMYPAYRYPYKVGERIKIGDRFMVIDGSSYSYKGGLESVDITGTNKYSLTTEDVLMNILNSDSTDSTGIV